MEGKQTRRLSRRRLLWLAGGGAVALAVSLLARPRLSDAPGPGVRRYVNRNGDLIEVRPVGQKPAFLPDYPPELWTLYQFALANQEKLRYIPCFCGCADMGHRNNADCYLDEQQPGNGLVAWNAHGFG